MADQQDQTTPIHRASRRRPGPSDPGQAPLLRSVVSLNILHGAGPRRGPDILLALLEEAPDLIALTEFRSAFGGQIAGVLADHGWHHQLSTEPPDGVNGVMLASRLPLRRLEPQQPAATPPLRQRESAWIRKILHAEVADGTLVTAVHVPDARRSDADRLCSKAASWHRVLGACRCWRERRHLVVGDLNTGRHRLDEAGSTYTCTALLGRLQTMGYADAWRLLRGSERGSTWFSHWGEGFRHDQAWVSASLAPSASGIAHRWLVASEPGTPAPTDHAALRLDLS